MPTIHDSGPVSDTAASSAAPSSAAAPTSRPAKRSRDSPRRLGAGSRGASKAPTSGEEEYLMALGWTSEGRRASSLQAAGQIQPMGIAGKDADGGVTRATPLRDLSRVAQSDHG